MKEKGHYRSIIGCCLEDGSFHFTAFRFLPNEIICKAYVSRVHFNTFKKDNSLSKSIDEQILLIHLCTLVRPTHHLY